MRVRSWSRVFATSLVTTGILALAMVSPVAASNNVIVLGYMGDCQFLGASAGANKTVQIDWRDSDGNLKSKQSVKSNSSGQFTTLCDAAEIIESGDVLKTTIGTSVRSITVPQLTANIDRVADTVSGKASPAPTSFEVDVLTYDGGFDSSVGTIHVSTPTPVSGSYTTTSWDVAPNIKGFDEAQAQWADSRGDTFIANRIAQGVLVWERQPFFSLAGNPHQSVTTTLYSSAHVDLDDETTAINLFGQANGTFLDSAGDGERIAAGDHVTSNVASDADFDIPLITATANKTTDKVTVNCGLATVGVLVDAYTRDASTVQARTGTTDGSGNFTANFHAAPAFNIVSGSKLDVYCKLSSGDEVARTFTVS